MKRSIPSLAAALLVVAASSAVHALDDPQIGRGFVESFPATGTPAVPAGTIASDGTAGCMGRYDPL